MSKEPTLVIMAAGMGSRYGGLKQMDKITEAGEIILDFSLYDAYMAGFKKAVLIIKQENEDDFREILKDKAARFMDIEFAYQKLDDIPDGYEIPQGREKPWGTGHAVLAAREKIDGPFAVINADDYYGPSAFEIIYEYLEKDGEDYCMVAYNIENTITENGHVSRGVCRTENGFLADIHERTKIMRVDGIISYEGDDKWYPIEEGTPVSMNFWGFTADFMKNLEERFPAFLEENNRGSNPQKGEYPLPAVVDDLITSGMKKVRVLTTTDKWCGVTYKADKENVTNTLQSMKDRGIYPERLFGTVDEKNVK